uniref:AB hydrolase-1 domain-containing protein n=1 Tax=Chromera velia CCMP2878 TaxID=1169474 RepID=A0A0G4GIL2_9ALVE|eukprot:Cvel_4762.t1-p1 / transcript=Cvel_4762.t1 / gene=Cvel_4762 / organism=Chromera_velia_CCMP2878 / gene_product=hypothetical protein / transcript_product=hypothetical protein / location=Cvel_scaffold212:72324-73475(-) / protein_length=384 / sequence_SO=supercontig / SO=protein_coding / is_pseudo=false
MKSDTRIVSSSPHERAAALVRAAIAEEGRLSAGLRECVEKEKKFFVSPEDGAVVAYRLLEGRRRLPGNPSSLPSFLLVLLNGFACSMETWNEEWLQLLSEGGHSIVLVDHRGVGDTRFALEEKRGGMEGVREVGFAVRRLRHDSLESEVTLPKMAADISSLLAYLVAEGNELGLQNPGVSSKDGVNVGCADIQFVLVGFSFGALIGQSVIEYLKGPDMGGLLSRLKALVILDQSVAPMHEDLGWAERDKFASEIARMEGTCDLSGFFKNFEPNLWGVYDPSRELRESWDGATARLVKEHLVGQMRSTLSFDGRGFLETYTFPVLVCLAQQGLLAHCLQKACEFYRSCGSKKGRREVLTFEGPHLIFHFCVKDLARAVLKFLGDV